MIVFIALLMTVLTFAFVAYPLFKRRSPSSEARYKRKAASTLRSIDDLGKDTEVEEEIERQVRKLRQSKHRFCPQCRARCQKGDRFCCHCGASLGQGGRVD